MIKNIWFNLLKTLLNQLRIGRVNLYCAKAAYSFGETQSVLTVDITINDPSAFKWMILGGSVGTAETYMAGMWDCDDLTKLFLIFIRNYEVLNKVDGCFSYISGGANKLLNLARKNTISQSKKNISAHYDLSNEFYQLFLDETMMYSAGIFKTKDMSLKEASTAKLNRICQQLKLNKNDHVLEIGTGWGGFAIYAVQNYGCQVTTTTISKAQYDLAYQRIHDLGLEHKITLLFEDYRNLTGTYDKLVSIEMIEAVGAKYYPTYFKVCSERLKPGGLLMLQAITIADKFYHRYKRDVDFIKKYIFPGGCLPSLKAIVTITAKHTNLQVQDVFSLGYDYALTLDQWCQNFEAQIETIKQLGFDMSFIKMWRYYLRYCEAGFLQKHINDFQILFHKAEHFN